jgi:osmoprotectant transport system substrate-binding protein
MHQTSRIRRAIAPLVLVVVLASSCADAADQSTVVRVGSGSTAEQQLLAALGAEVLERAGFDTVVQPALGDTTAVRAAALDGRIDVYWDYSGAAWTLALRLTSPPVDPQESFEAVAAEEDANGLLWLTRSGADARLAFFVPAEIRPEGTEGSLTWLAGRLGAEDGTVCADAEYFTAPAGYAYLADTYAIATDGVRTRDTSEEDAIAGTATGRCTTALAAATSGEASAAGLTPLIDDQGVFPSLVVAPVVVESGRADGSAQRAVLEDLATSLTTEDLALMNAQVVEGVPVADVARDYVDDNGLG